MLNASKGPAVRGPRAQMDRVLYKRAVQGLLAGVPNLHIHDGAVVDLLVEQRPAGSASTAPSSSGGGSSSSSSSSPAGGGGGPAVAGVVLASGERILCRAVVITTGTFLRGVIHVGSQARPAGRIASLIAARAASKPEHAAGAVRAAEMTDRADEVAAGAATALAQRFAGLGFALGRLKTGTPPRLDGAPLLGLGAAAAWHCWRWKPGWCAPSWWLAACLERSGRFATHYICALQLCSIAGRTIDWSVCEEQPGDSPPTPFSFLHLQQPGWRPAIDQVGCRWVGGAGPPSSQLSLQQGLRLAGAQSPDRQSVLPSHAALICRQPLLANRPHWTAATAGILLPNPHHRRQLGADSGVHGRGCVTQLLLLLPPRLLPPSPPPPPPPLPLLLPGRHARHCPASLPPQAAARALTAG